MIVDISTSATKKFFALYARGPMRIVGLVIGPEGDLAADGTDYYTVNLVKYHDGVMTGLVIDETTLTFSTATRSLTVGTPVALPPFGRMDEWLVTDDMLYVNVVKVNSPGALAAKVQIDVIGGR